MPYPLNYRRPTYVTPASRGSLSGEDKQKSINDSIMSRDSGNSGSSLLSNGIPNALSFDRILSGGTCPPCTLRDFMNYLKYIEHSAENLQFYLWHKDYSKRFDELPESQRRLSPEWTVEQPESEASAVQSGRQKKISPEAAAMFKGTKFAPKASITDNEKFNPFYTPPRTPSSDSRSGKGSMEYGQNSEYQLSTRTNYAERAEGAYREAGLKWQPFTVQPFREEITRIIAIYIADDSPRQLNLSGRERASLLHALTNTTHPSAFRDVMVTVEWSLRCQAHPNFIRWTICNGNRPRVIFARGLGIFGIAGGILTALLLTLSKAGRAWRVISLIPFMIGIATLIAAWKGMCVVLHGMHHRHLRPWELFADAEEIQNEDEKKQSMDSLNSSNSYESEPWVARYQKRNIIRKIFDREVWVEEPMLRQIQDTIFIQALLGAFVISAVAVGIFCAVPKGNFF